MELSVYNKVSEVLRKCRARRDIKKLAAEHGFEGIPSETLISIYTLEVQRIMKKTFHLHNTEEQKTKYYKMFFERTDKNEKNVILTMAKEVDLTPCMLIRFILDVYMAEKDPELKAKPKARARAITELLRPSRKVPDPGLARAIHLAVLGDDIYGPYPDRIRRALGIEFEERLREWLDEQNIRYETEDDMRKKGFDKTPDFKLTLPVAFDGFVANWIESKAMFGNEEWHTKHVKEQVGPYTRRYGPGLVVYWFGYIDALDCQRSGGIALCEGLPQKVEKLDLTEWEKHPDWEMPKAAVW